LHECIQLGKVSLPQREDHLVRRKRVCRPVKLERRGERWRSIEVAPVERLIMQERRLVDVVHFPPSSLSFLPSSLTFFLIIMHGLEVGG
jgi:hypothetical protein